jgi:hypothetical protein
MGYHEHKQLSPKTVDALIVVSAKDSRDRRVRQADYDFLEKTGILGTLTLKTMPKPWPEGEISLLKRTDAIITSGAQGPAVWI